MFENATAEQKFAIMLLERIEKLEDRIHELEKVPMIYIAADNVFSDGSQIIWDWGANISNIRLNTGPMTEKHWNAKVIFPYHKESPFVTDCKNVEIHIPTICRRTVLGEEVLVLSNDSTVRELFSGLYSVIHIECSYIKIAEYRNKVESLSNLTYGGYYHQVILAANSVLDNSFTTITQYAIACADKNYKYQFAYLNCSHLDRNIGVSFKYAILG